MKTTDLFRESLKQDSSITWKDIFSKSFVKHSQADIEHVMSVGTLSRRVTEESMLQRWHRPWLWWVVAKYGIGLIFVLYMVLFVCMIVFNEVSQSLYNMVMIIPPIVVPAIIMILLWELNVPQNISFLHLWMYFLVGGIICFAVNSLMFLPFPTDLPAYYAAFREEPAKLVASVLILLYLQRVKKQKIYGCTGLVIGAAVGAAFSGIESVSYAINNSSAPMEMLYVQMLRSLLALGGHIVYCTAYTTAITVNSKGGRLTVRSFFNPMTIGSFLFSTALHAVWNGVGSLYIQVPIVFVCAFVLLYWVKLCFKDIVKGRRISARSSSPSRVALKASKITVNCKSTALAGMHWQSTGQPLVIGRQKNTCKICFPENTKGVSREHCKIVKKGNGWYLQDLQSAYGTYIQDRKLIPYELYPINVGDRIYLGSKQVCLMIS